MVIASLKTGLAQVWNHKRLLLIFYAANLTCGLILMVPLRAALSSFIEASAMGKELGGLLSMDFLFEFIKNNGAAISTVGVLFFVVAALNCLVTLLLSGGALAIFAAGSKYEAAVFWSKAGKFFGRFARLALWSGLVLGLMFCLQFLWTGIERLVFGSDPYQNVLYWGSWIKVGLRGLGFMLFWLVFDYARIHLVLTDEPRTRVSLWRGLKFAFRRLYLTFSLALLLILIGGVALLLYNPIADSLSAGNALIVFMLFVCQQLYMLFRMVLRLTSYASQMHLYQSAQLAAAPEETAPLIDEAWEGWTPAME